MDHSGRGPGMRNASEGQDKLAGGFAGLKRTLRLGGLFRRQCRRGLVRSCWHSPRGTLR